MYAKVVTNPPHRKSLPDPASIPAFLAGFDRAYADGYCDSSFRDGTTKELLYHKLETFQKAACSAAVLAQS